MVIEISKQEIAWYDYDGDGKIDKQEWEDYIKFNGLDPKKEYEIEGTKYKGTLDQLKTLLEKNEFKDAAQSGEAKAPVTPEAKKASADLNKYLVDMKKLTKEIEDAKKNNNMETKELEAKQKQLLALLDQAKQAVKDSGRTNVDLSSFAEAAGDGGQKVMSGKAQVTQPGAKMGGGAAAQTAGAQAGAKSFYPPAGWKANTLGADGFTTDTYLKSMSMQDSMMSSWDSINKNTSKGKQLMMLFFYYARMAESGDLTAMYQFMKFITYIISKDKAKQQIDMGNKLIALQELSRDWTNKLLGASTDSSDPDASNKLMITMTEVKSQTDAIATSQKLISQMMEEFAQVVEMLTNTTKSTLDAAGKVGSRVSNFQVG